MFCASVWERICFLKKKKKKFAFLGQALRGRLISSSAWREGPPPWTHSSGNGGLRLLRWSRSGLRELWRQQRVSWCFTWKCGHVSSETISRWLWLGYCCVQSWSPVAKEQAPLLGPHGTIELTFRETGGPESPATLELTISALLFNRNPRRFIPPSLCREKNTLNLISGFRSVCHSRSPRLFRNNSPQCLEPAAEVQLQIARMAASRGCTPF